MNETSALNLWIPIAPMSKGRPRCTCRGRPPTPRMHTPRTTEVWENTVATLIRNAWRGPPMNGPLRLQADLVADRPKARPPMSNKDRRAAGDYLVTPEAWSTGERIFRPNSRDVDNEIKALMDALNKSGIWHDDGQVCWLVARQWYAAKDEEGGIRVRIEMV